MSEKQASSEIAERFEKWWAESRKLNPDCGCEQRGQRWFKCSYHEGADDAWEWAERDTRERLAQLAQEVAKEVGGQFADTHMLNTGLLEFIARLERIRGKEEVDE